MVFEWLGRFLVAGWLGVVVWTLVDQVRAWGRRQSARTIPSEDRERPRKSRARIYLRKPSPARPWEALDPPDRAVIEDILAARAERRRRRRGW